MQQFLVGQLVDDAGVQHQVALRPARQAEQAQQPVQHFGPLGQQRQIALAAQQRLEPVDEGGRGGFAAALLPDRVGGAAHQAGQALLAVVAQQSNLGVPAERTHALGKHRRQGLEKGLVVDRRLCRLAASARSAAAAVAPVVEQPVELLRHEFARLAQALEQGAGAAEAERQARGDPVEVGVVGRQHMRLLIVEVLDAVLDAAQQGVGVGQPLGGGALHQAAGSELVERLQGRAGADFGKLAAAHHQQQLHDELDLADAAARQLHVVGPLGPPGRPALRVAAYLGVQLAQALEDAVVEIAAVDESRHQGAQGQRPAVLHADQRRDDTAFQPGEALPFAAVRLQVFVEHRQAHHRRARLAVRPQGQVDAEDEAVFGHLADQRIKPARHLREVLVGADRLAAAGALTAVRRAGFFVDIDEVDVRRDVQLAGAELAHADDPEVDALAGGVARHAVAPVLLRQHVGERQVERGFGQRRHRPGHVAKARRVFDVDDGQMLENELTCHAQSAGERAAVARQAIDQRRDRSPIRHACRCGDQLVRPAATDALHETAVFGCGHVGR